MSVINRLDSSKGDQYSRPAGIFTADPLRLQVIPWVINVTATSSGTKVLNTNREINQVREIKLVAVFGATTTVRRVHLDSDMGGFFLQEQRIHTDQLDSNSNPVLASNDLIVAPGASLGDGLVVASWRDGTGKVPRKLNITQFNPDGTPLTGSNAITLVFNVTCVQFQ
jgi:hypothetical protein